MHGAGARPEPLELQRFIRFASALVRDNGQRMEIEPFERKMLADYFDGCRSTLILIPKKNGKTTLIAALCLFHLIVQDDAATYVAAASRDQANTLYNQAKGFVRRTEGLSELLAVKKGTREIRSRRDDGFLWVLAANEETADGVIPTLAVVEEYHQHKSPALAGVLADGLGPRSGRIITISTAGEDEETSPLGQDRAAAHKFPHVERHGRYLYARSANGHSVLHEWALRQGDDVDDMSVVKLANPASWQTEEELQIRHDDPRTRPWQWARFGCGLWVRGEHTAIQSSAWDACASADATIPEGADVNLGLDLGWRSKNGGDTTALVPLWMASPDRRVFGTPTVIVPPPDGTVAANDIREALAWYRARYTVTVVYDPNAGAHQLQQDLAAEFPDLRWVEHSQDNAPVALASERFDEALRLGQIVHDGDRTFRAHALNAIERRLGGDRWRYDRASRGPRVPIDLLTAALIAHSNAVADFEQPAFDLSAYRIARL